MTPQVLEDLPEIPYEAMWYLSAWMDLSARRQPGAHGPGSITWPDVDAWLRVTGTRVTRRDLSVIFAIEGAWRDVVAARLTPAVPSKKPGGAGGRHRNHR